MAPNPRKRQRLRRAQINRRLAELDAKPGLDPELIDTAKREAETRMEVVDKQLRPWRDLLNEYPHTVISDYVRASQYRISVDALRDILSRQFPGA